MQLASLPGGRDGRLSVISRDHTRCVTAEGIAATLQDALERWSEVEPALRRLADDLEAGRARETAAFDAAHALAPLPRAWQWLDGSAFHSHGALMQKVFHLDPVPQDRPLMYQGMSDRFIPPCASALFPSEADGIDFEGEYGIVTDTVPMGVSAVDATAHIRLIVLINDWSLRSIAPIEMKTGFGWVQAKPACSAAPVAVTPDALGSAWHDGRVALPLRVARNGERFGEPDGSAMGFSFPELVAHAARTRALVAGTIIGSGTVSNAGPERVGSCCIAERRALELLEHGAPRTPYLNFGERVRMECLLPDGTSLFGAIDQAVIRG